MIDVYRLASNAARLLRSPSMVKSYIRWQYSRLIHQREPLVSFDGGIQFTGFGSFSQFWLRRFGLDAEDLAIIKACKQATLPNAVAIDVGANIGLFSLAFAKAGFTQIHAFEPIAPTFDRFSANLRLNPCLSDKITPNQLGVGSAAGVMQFVIFSNSPEQNKLVTDSIRVASQAPLTECMVVTFDQYRERHNIQRVGLLKIDVEGFEVDVLNGASNSLLACAVDFIYLEIISEALQEAGSSIIELKDLLEKAGFAPVRPLPDAKCGFELLTFENALRMADKRRNLLFKRMR